MVKAICGSKVLMGKMFGQWFRRNLPVSIPCNVYMLLIKRKILIRFLVIKSLKEKKKKHNIKHSGKNYSNFKMCFSKYMTRNVALNVTAF